MHGATAPGPNDGLQMGCDAAAGGCRLHGCKSKHVYKLAIKSMGSRRLAVYPANGSSGDQVNQECTANVQLYVPIKQITYYTSQRELRGTNHRTRAVSMVAEKSRLGQVLVTWVQLPTPIHALK